MKNEFIILVAVFTFMCYTEGFTQTELLSDRHITPAVYGKVYHPRSQTPAPGIILLPGSGGIRFQHHEYARDLVLEGYQIVLVALYAETSTAPAGSAKHF